MPSLKTIRDLLVHDAIYIIRGRINGPKEHVLYIGKAGRQSVTDRLRMHLNRSRREKKTKFAELIAATGDRYLDWTIEVLLPPKWKKFGEDLDTAERELIRRYCPKCNRQHMRRATTRIH